MAREPPFPVPQGKSGLWEEVAGPEVSDGDVRQWPGKPLYRPVPETHYLISLATAWVKDQNLEQPNFNYYLDKLPDGYALFEMERPGVENQGYKRLFGHPTGRYYDSAKRFEVHFIWLMRRMEGDCECVLCSGKKAPVVRRSDAFRLDRTMLGRPESRTQSRDVARVRRDDSSGRSKSATGLASERGPGLGLHADSVTLPEKRQPKAAESALPVDEEGTEDVYKRQIQELYKFKHKKVKDKIVEKYSFDWKAERKSLPAHLSQVSLQHSFIPRIGELVLWCPYFPDELDLIFNPETGFYQFYSFDQERFLGFPNWRGGVIAAVPSSIATDGPLDFPDILSNPMKKNAYNTSGFRVETLPDPNNDMDKSLSKQYKYVPLRQIRPLGHWQTLLRGIPERKIDASFKYALTAMTTISLVEKFRFVGDWPNAAIHCRGIYIGAELVVVGDAVRILPPLLPAITPANASTPTPTPKANRSTDILVISSIRLNLHDITPEHTLPASRTLSTHSSITLLGHAYTLDPHRDYRVPVNLDISLPVTEPTLPPPLPPEEVKSIFPTVGAKHYGDWFPLHAPHLKYEVSFDRVLGRLHEADAVRLWTGLAQTKNSTSSDTTTPRRPGLSHDLSGVLAGRKYAAQTDERIPQVAAGEVRWFWADTRVQALNVETFNGYEVGRYDRLRQRGTVRAWRAMLRVLDGTAGVSDVKDTRLPQRKGRQKGARLVDGRVVYPVDDDVSEGGSGNRGGVMKGESRLGLGLGLGRGRTSSFLTGMAGSQMLMAGLAQDESDEEEDGTSGGEAGLGNESGNGRASANVSGLDSGADAPISEGMGAGEQQQRQAPGRGRAHLARKNVRKGKKPKRIAIAPLSKMQIMASGEAGDQDDDDDDDDDNNNNNNNRDDDDDDDDDESEDDAEDYDYDAVQDIVEGHMPLARGGTEESEGGDYDPLLESFQSTTSAARRNSSGAGSRPREKRMRL